MLYIYAASLFCSFWCNELEEFIKRLLLIIQVIYPNSFTLESSKINSVPGINNDVELCAENAISGYIIFQKTITFPRRCAPRTLGIHNATQALAVPTRALRNLVTTPKKIAGGSNSYFHPCICICMYGYAYIYIY